MAEQAPKLLRGPLREVRSRYFDSARWNDFEFRADDIVIATYPKCGTTWTQRIVGMLIFGTATPFAVQDISPWPDMRLTDIHETNRLARSQTHRRFLKTHLPYDSLPIAEGVKFIHVARDGRDAAMSFFNHKLHYSEGALQLMNEISLNDPKFGTPCPAVKNDAAGHFHDWVAGAEDDMGDPAASYFHFENSFWAVKNDPDVLLVHYNDLKADLAGEMRRIAEFLGVTIAADLWPALVEAAGFESMKRRASELMPSADFIWKGGGDTFLHKGTNGRWQGVYALGDLVRYDEKVKANFSPALAAWAEHGRLVAGDPRNLQI